MNPRVLLVDDERLIASSLALYLEDEGMQVSLAESAEQAIEQVESGRDFQLCIMDIRLPGMDGDTAIGRLHRLDPSLKFVIHTGSSDYSLSPSLRHIGISDTQLFRKPMLDMQPLAQMIRTLTSA